MFDVGSKLDNEHREVACWPCWLFCRGAGCIGIYIGGFMKKSLSLIMLLVASLLPCVQADTGGAVAAGVAAGLFTGIATTAIANSGSRSSDRAEAQALKAREENEQMRREQDRERVDTLRRDQERREIERKDEQIRQLNDHLSHIERQSGSGTSSIVFYLLFGFILMLTMAVGTLALMLLRKK